MDTEPAPLWRGWSAPRPTRIEALERALCLAFEVPPRRLFGSHVGDLHRLRSLLMALAIDVQLVPATLCAERYGLTPAGVQKAIRRGRAELHARPELRRELARVLVPALGYRVP